MAWTTPKTWNTGDPVTASEMNTQVRDNLDYLKDQWSEYVHVRDQKSNSTHGGTFTSGAYRQRDLNQVVSNPSSLGSLASNELTLPAGTYFAIAWAPAYRVDGHKLFVRTSGGSDLMYGQNAYTNHVRKSHVYSTGSWSYTCMIQSHPIRLRNRILSARSRRRN